MRRSWCVASVAILAAGWLAGCASAPARPATHEATLVVGTRPPAAPHRPAPPSAAARRDRPRPPVSEVGGGRTVALTFDDGPDPTWTPRVLAVLARAGVNATFCLIGRQAAADPALVRRIVEAGHTLCDHTWDHDLDLRARSPARIRADIVSAYDAIIDAGGVAPVFFRAPGGNWSPYL